MKRCGFPDYLASIICMASSTMGNMIPPSGIIVASFGVLATLYGEDTYTMSQFWMLMWGICLWFILQRAVTIFVFCRYHHIEALPASEVPRFGEAVRKGWRSLLIPVVILLPVFLDAQRKSTFFTTRLTAEGASALSSCVLLFTPGIAAVYALFIIRKSMKVGPRQIAGLLAKGTKSIVPVSATIFFAYCISNLFESIHVGENIGNLISSWGFGLVPLAFILPLFTAILGMILPGSSQVAIFGTAIVSVMAAAGANPFLVAGMLPVICGAMEGMTPPLALCMYTAMGISGSEMKQTTQNCVIWCVLHYLLSVVFLIGIVPLFGMVDGGMDMKKVSGFLSQVFGWGAYVSIFAGAAGFVGFVVALIIGGDTGAAIAIAVKAQWFPLVIKVASVSVGLGLIGMYCGKEEALSMAADK